jgi:hypothetical protein
MKIVSVIRTPLFALALGSLLALAAHPVSAQVTASPTDVISSGTAYYLFTEPGQATIRVIVLGAVSPGIYEIGEGVTLSELVSLVRGNPSGEISDQTSREVRVQLYRESGGLRAVIYEADYDDFLRRPGSHPSLEDNDALVVEVTTRKRLQFRDVLQIVSATASLTLLVLRLTGSF